MTLWDDVSRARAENGRTRCPGWAMRSRLEPIRKAAKMIREHLDGLITAIVYRATNAGAESINATIQRVKRMACGCRNRGRFRAAIYFHLGGLDLHPATYTHTDS